MKAVIFDTETSDLISNGSIKLSQQPEVIEFYGEVVDLSTGEHLNELDLLIKPSKPIGEETTRITGITNEMLTDAPRFGDVAGAVSELLACAQCVIAHNLSFDMEMIEIEMKRIGRSVAWPRRKVCTVEQTVHLKGYRLSLTALHEELFGEKFADAHRARNDVAALTRCAVELFRRGAI